MFVFNLFLFPINCRLGLEAGLDSVYVIEQADSVGNVVYFLMQLSGGISVRVSHYGAEFHYLTEVVSTTSPHHKRIYPSLQLASKLCSDALEPVKILFPLTFHPKI